MMNHIYFCMLMCFLATVSCDQYHVVNTSSGKIRGKIQNYQDVKVYQFQSIPYAKPPIGELRFRKPQPIGSWEYTLDATKDSSPCYQPQGFMGLELTTNDRISEDCLFLNIHVPRDISISKNRAVMIWIHGGGFNMGQGSWYDGSSLAVKGDVIVVTINYRLDIFGFLSTFDSASPGNYGLWDQKLAIEWVRSNIAAFGGNPDSITLFGESAGGFSVSYQAFHPLNKGLFKRVIAQSGSIVSLPLVSNSDKYIEFLAKTLRCQSDSSFALMECLRHKPADELLNASQIFAFQQVSELNLKWAVGPSLDNDFFPQDPKITLSDKSSQGHQFFNSLDYMAGTTDGEGSVLLMILYMWAEKLKINPSDGVRTETLCDVLTKVMAETYLDNSPGAAEALCEKYKVVDGNGNKQIEQGSRVAEMNGDVFFQSPATKTLMAHQEESTYQYLFTRPIKSVIGMMYPEWFQGSAHGSELPFLFGLKTLAHRFNITLTEYDLTLEDYMIKYWSNFAKFGNPNGEGLPWWPEFGQDQNYLHLGHKTTAGKKLFEDRMKFLIDEIPKIADKIDKEQRIEL